MAKRKFTCLPQHLQSPRPGLEYCGDVGARPGAKWFRQLAIVRHSVMREIELPLCCVEQSELVEAPGIQRSWDVDTRIGLYAERVMAAQYVRLQTRPDSVSPEGRGV